MLRDFNCKYVIIGHSERRIILKESDEIIHKKLHQILFEDLSPILCIGETMSEKNENKTKDILRNQILSACNNISNDLISKIMIAYEPIWAIGTGLIGMVLSWMMM